MANPPKDIATSIRQRLLNLARESDRGFQALLVAYGLERLIFRLSKSKYKDRFVLKGGMLAAHWMIDSGRFTRDIDFLAFGDDDSESLISIYTEILSYDAGDGIEFDTDSLTATDIRGEHLYGGKRLKTIAYLGKTKIPITVDLGFGDALIDLQYEIEHGSILDFEPARIRAYSPATLIAEKFEAVVALGLINSRMKDYYDLWMIPRCLTIERDDLHANIVATFKRRNTPIPTNTPAGLSDSFANDADKAKQWLSYAESTELKDIPLDRIVADIWSYINGAL